MRFWKLVRSCPIRINEKDWELYLNGVLFAFSKNRINRGFDVVPLFLFLWIATTPDQHSVECNVSKTNLEHVSDIPFALHRDMRRICYVQSYTNKSSGNYDLVTTNIYPQSAFSLDIWLSFENTNPRLNIPIYISRVLALSDLVNLRQGPKLFSEGKKYLRDKSKAHFSFSAV